MAFESFASSLIPTLATANAWTDEEELLRTEVVGLKVPEIEDVSSRKLRLLIFTLIVEFARSMNGHIILSLQSSESLMRRHFLCGLLMRILSAILRHMREEVAHIL